jgi:peptidoglycan/xylan/chitin deacetylase (PgdA/CDA1 family)
MPILEMMKVMASEGHDIGLHGSFYSAADSDLLARQKRVIEETTGLEVKTTRQHWLNWDVGVTPACQTRAGLKADCTLGFNRNVGFRSGTGLPYRLFDLASQERIPLLEVPLIIQDGSLIASNALEYDFEMARDVTRKLIDRVAEVNGCINVLFHPHNFVNDIYVQLYKWVIEYSLESGAWVTSLGRILDWWIARESVFGNSQ